MYAITYAIEGDKIFITTPKIKFTNDGVEIYDTTINTNIFIALKDANAAQKEFAKTVERCFTDCPYKGMKVPYIDLEEYQQTDNL
jgi:hypothetical protein